MLTPHQTEVLRRLMGIVSYTAPEAIEDKLRMAIAAYVPAAAIAAGSPEDTDPHASGRQWVQVGEATGSVTYAMEIRGEPNSDYHRGRLRGTLVRVVDFDDGEGMSSSVVFLRDVSLEEVSRG